MNFEDLDIIPPILQALKTKGYQSPTPIQHQAIPPILEKKDLLGCAQTGTGKTAAFTLPTLQLLNELPPSRKGKRKIKSLVLTPTRELAIQISECLEDYSLHLPLRHTVIFGGIHQSNQTPALEKGVDILVATPGRLLDLIEQGYVDLSGLRIFTLDEVDQMLDIGFIHDIRKILKYVPKRRQTLFFSATMPPRIKELADELLTNPVEVAITPAATPAETVKQRVFFVERGMKRHLLVHLIDEYNMKSALIFTRTKHRADRVVKNLKSAGISAEAIHGNKSQGARQRALKNFKAGTTRVLVATDVAARGIDIDQLSWVFNFDLPNIPETYVHRIGRTGRAGADGTAFSFCERDEKPYLKSINKLLNKEIPHLDHPFIEEKKPNERNEQQTQQTNSSAAKKKKPKPYTKNHKRRKKPGNSNIG